MKTANKLKAMAVSMLIGASVVSPVLASATNQVVCTSQQFPNGIGSTLGIRLGSNGEPSGEAYLSLHDNAPGSSLQTNGWFNISAPTFNEDGNTVNFYQWSGGGGLGQNGSEHLNLIPKRMVTYGFKENYKQGKKLFLGVITWTNNSKIEQHYIFNCQ